MGLKERFPFYWICDCCAAERGGRWPEGHVATLKAGTCEYCDGKKQTEKFIAPWVDYDWLQDEEATALAQAERD